MFTKRKITQVTAFLAVLLVVTAGIALADSDYDPGIYDDIKGNPTCSDFGDNWFEFKVEPVESGTYTSPDGYFTVTLDVNATMKTFDWSSNKGVDAVFVKGGPGGILYVYQGNGKGAEVYKGFGLHAPLNKNGSYYGLSHVSFCYDFEVDVEKDAHTSFTRTYTWDIDKEFDEDYVGFAGDSWEHWYTITVDRTGHVDSDWAVEGSIWIENNTPLAATITSVSDVISPDIAADVDCGVTFPYELASGAMLTCDYASDLPDGADRLNTATVATSGMVGGGIAKADVLFDGATMTEVYAEVNITDDYGTEDPGDDLEFGPTSGYAQYTYSRVFECSTDPGDYDNGSYVHDALINWAEIDETGDSDSAEVNVTCYAPVVEKDVDEEFTRYWKWEIVKDFSGEYDLFAGEEVEHDYFVSVDPTYTDNDWKVSGQITVYNYHPSQVMILTSLWDVAGGIAATVECPSMTVPAGGTLVCDYYTPVQDAPDANPFGNTNTATALFAGSEWIGTAPIVFPTDPTHEDDPVITVDDDNLVGEAWSADRAYAEWEYSKIYDCSADPAEYTEGMYSYDVLNTATINETGQHDSETVTINCYAPVVTKYADEDFTRYWEWTIVKHWDGEYELFAGQSVEHDYVVSVTPTSYDNDWMVSGEITVYNPHPTADMLLTSLTDDAGGIPAVVDCGGDLTVPAMGYLVCSYETAAQDSKDANPFGGTNTATAMFADSPWIGTAPIEFPTEPTAEVDPVITVDDDNLEDEGWSADRAFAEWTYKKVYTCSADPGDYVNGYDTFTVLNTATINETGQNDIATVKVECYLPSIDKTVETDFNRYYTWDITKTVDPASWDLFMGESGTSRYTITIDRSGPFDNDWQVSGTITISNPAPMDLALTSVTDNLPGFGDVSVDCSGITTVPAHGTLVCSYNTGPQDAEDANPFGSPNYAEATYAIDLETEYTISVTKPVSFGEPTAIIDESATVVDSVEGLLGTFTGDDEVSYDKTFTCGADEGLHENTVTLTTDDQGLVEEDDADVDVDCYDLTIEKTANTGYTVEYEWEIAKYAVDSGPFIVYPSDTVLAEYEVEVWVTDILEYGQYIYGTVTITNTHPSASAELLGLSDSIPGYGDVPLTCPAGWDLLPPGGSVQCSYSISVTGWNYYNNYASVTQQLYDYDHTGLGTANGTKVYEAEAAINWTGPTTILDETIDVYDETFGTYLGTANESESPKTFTFSAELTAPEAYCGLWEVENEAYFIAQDTGATDNAFAYVTLDIQCATDGCTPGFWRGGAGSKLWDEKDDPDWTGEGTNPFTHEYIFNDFFALEVHPWLDGETMWSLISNAGGISSSAERAARTMVAAYLNESAFPGTYAYTDLDGLLAEWYAAVLAGDEALDAFHYKYDDFNNYGCPLP